MIPARSAQHGFTLIELMIVVALLAIISAFALPAFQSFIASNRLTSEANELLAGLNLARSEAVRTQCATRLCRASFASDGTPSCVETNNSEPWEAWAVIGSCSGNPLRTQTMPRTLSMMSNAELASARNSILFRPDGLARPLDSLGALQSAQIIVCDRSGALSSNNVRTVTLQSGNRVAVTRSTDANCGVTASEEAPTEEQAEEGT